MCDNDPEPGSRLYTRKVEETNCHACLEAMVRHGDLAVKRILELDRKADEAT